ncbi:MAG: DUF87 domain-containing protein [Candidatus Blackburnbacteria bacterium]|nr:DUF87 domain-containing protein [Candidatus Blackburnbacteria bacterium]
MHTLELRPDRNFEGTTEASAQIFSSLASIKSSFLKKLFGEEEPIVFEILSFDQKTHFFVHLPEDIASYVESQIVAQYPKVSILGTSDPLVSRLAGKKVAYSGLGLSAAFYYPLKTWRDFSDSDPLSAILGAMAKAENDDILLVQIVVLPAGSGWRNAGSRAISQGIVGSDGLPKAHPKAALIERKLAQNGFRVGIRLLAASADEKRSRQLVSSLAGSFGALTLGESNSFSLSQPHFYQQKSYLGSIIARTARYVPSSQFLTVDELATIFHLPSLGLSGIKNVSWGGSLLGEPPDDLPIAIGATDEERSKINFLARTEFKNQLIAFGIKKIDRRRHVYIIGKTGTGKSTLIANMAINDMRNGEGVAVVDPHGDLSEILLDYIPSYRINDVAYLDAASSAKRPFRMNLFEVKNPEHGELVASGVVSIFQKLYGYSWGPRLEYILRNAILTLVARPNSTLVDVPRILTDPGFRRSVVENITDPVLKNFWSVEFEQMGDRLQAEAISPILNKVGQFVSSPTIREIIGYPTSTIDLEDVMNNGKIIILNLSQGRLGEDNAALLGALLITKIQLAAMNRASIREEERRDFYLYVDEFQNFATSSFIKILSEARKYRLNLTVANQYAGQVAEDVQKAIFGNVGTLISFLVGAEDAQILTREFGSTYKEEDLVGLDNFQTILKLAIDGKTSRPFFGYTLPLPRSKNQNREKVVRVSQERYTREAGTGFLEQYAQRDVGRDTDTGTDRRRNERRGSSRRDGGGSDEGRRGPRREHERDIAVGVPRRDTGTDKDRSEEVVGQKVEVKTPVVEQSQEDSKIQKEGTVYEGK